METDVIYIADHAALGDLNIAMHKCSDDLSKLLQQVDKYLDQVKQGLEAQKAVLEKQYQEVEDRLNRAEQALSACEAKQRWDEESGSYRPSCNMQRGHVEVARRLRDRCRAKYEEACRIVSRADGAISHYRRHSMINPGPVQLLKELVEGHTDAATRELTSIIEDVADYLSLSTDIPSWKPYDGREPRGKTDERGAILLAAQKRLEELARQRAQEKSR